MLKKIAGIIDFKYAFRELLLIVGGILIALSINNWNDARKQRITEIKSLKEIKNTLQSDLRDLKYNIQGEKIIVSSREKLLQMQAQKIVFHDSLVPYFDKVFWDIYLAVNRSAFESIKSRGLDIISNDSLRLKIADLYDYAYKVIETNEKQTGDYLFQESNNFAEDIIPLQEVNTDRNTSYKNLMNKQDFKTFLKQSLTIEQEKLRQYGSLERRLQNLVAEIESEVKRLE
ncbi:MAG: hypothetical protein H7Y04_03555 [Verrucomicrobia bacterium]|nr:hypothetical protein [Cytophagales bacterium]